MDMGGFRIWVGFMVEITEVAGNVRIEAFKGRVQTGKTPFHVQEFHNITCIEGHNWAVTGLDLTQPQPPPIRTLAVGTGTVPAQESDRSLTNEVARIDVAEYATTLDSITTNSIISVDEANEADQLTEIGLYAGGFENEDTYFLNHGILDSPINKGNNISATVTVTLTYNAKQ